MLNVVLAFNYHNKEKYGIVSDEFDTPETIEIVKNAIELNGHKVILIEGDEDFYPRLKAMKDKNEVDLVFNYSVGIYGRSREAHIPAMCEMLQVPYASSDVLSTALCQDKARSKDVLSRYDIKTSDYQLFLSPEDRLTKKLNFPVIVKYPYQGTSIGLTDDKAVVHNEEDLYKRVKLLYEMYPQAILAEEYVQGREFTVGFFGHMPDVTFFPLIEIFPTPNQSQEEWVFNSREQPISGEVTLDKKMEDKIYTICKKIVTVFELKDWGRIDIRLNREGNEAYVLEINNCAHLSPQSVYFNGAKALGITHQELITNMLNSALKRHQLI